MIVFQAVFAAALELTDALLSFYIWILIIGAALSWLVAFGVVNMNNRFVQVLSEFYFRLTEPVLSRIRRFVPVIGGLDLSPLVVIFLIMFLQSFIRHLMLGL
jgi:YggT family protein